MKLISLNRYIGFLILFLSFLPLHAEEEIDIWNNDTKQKKPESIKPDINNSNTTLNFEILSKPNTNNSIKIEDQILDDSKD